MGAADRRPRHVVRKASTMGARRCRSGRPGTARGSRVRRRSSAAAPRTDAAGLRLGGVGKPHQGRICGGLAASRWKSAPTTRTESGRPPSVSVEVGTGHQDRMRSPAQRRHRPPGPDAVAWPRLGGVGKGQRDRVRWRAVVSPRSPAPGWRTFERRPSGCRPVTTPGCRLGGKPTVGITAASEARSRRQPATWCPGLPAGRCMPQRAIQAAESEPAPGGCPGEPRGRRRSGSGHAEAPHR
jgi:hypothetical protein